MSLTDYELTPAARRTLNIFLLVDTSTSMSGEKIAAVNDAVRNVIPIINSIAEHDNHRGIGSACRFKKTGFMREFPV